MPDPDALESWRAPNAAAGVVGGGAAVLAVTFADEALAEFADEL